MANIIPERTTNYMVYLDGGPQAVGLATVDLPDLESMSDTVSGAGIAGEYESPTIGHFGSMTATLNWRVFTGSAASLVSARARYIDLRGSMQHYDAGLGTNVHVPVRISIRGKSKTTALGSFEAGAAMDSSTEIEVLSIAIYVNNVLRIDIDKPNFRFVVDGVDELAEVRRNLGM